MHLASLHLGIFAFVVFPFVFYTSPCVFFCGVLGSNVALRGGNLKYKKVGGGLGGGRSASPQMHLASLHFYRPHCHLPLRSSVPGLPPEILPAHSLPPPAKNKGFFFLCATLSAVVLDGASLQEVVWASLFFLFFLLFFYFSLCVFFMRCAWGQCGCERRQPQK